jgi:hypothetical protein
MCEIRKTSGLDGILKQANKFLRQRRETQRKKEADRYKPKKEEIGRCNCGQGDIVLLTTYTSEFNPMSGPLIIGPGSRQQFRRVGHQECFCTACGAFFNPEIVRKNRKK